MAIFDKLRKREVQLSSEEIALELFFTNVEYLQKLFEEIVSANQLKKRILIIQGVGGSGKSTLLKMFRLFCKKQRIPVGLTSVDKAKNGIEILANFSEDLAKSGVKLRKFTDALQRYQAIQAKVEEKLRSGQSKIVNAGKTGVKVILEQAATTVLGPLGSVLGGKSAEALTDWLFGFLTKPEVEFYLTPLKLLTQEFLTDVSKTATKKRLVLMLDTYEQIGTLDDWVQTWVQVSHPNILIVLATRSFRGNDWERAWPGYMAQIQFEELKPMLEKHLQTLVSRYYQAIRSELPNSTQVEAVARFARGLPLVATTAAQLWATYGKTDFQTIKAQVVADLVDRLLEAVPKQIERLVETASTLRWFDQSVLRVVLDTDISNADFKELRQFPFTRPVREGKLALHDVVREVIDENLKTQDPARHRQWHERAAEYFEQELSRVSLTEQERLSLERLYHRIRADEATGIQLFQATAEELVRYRLIHRLKTLLSDVSTYPLEQENSCLWREYYRARVLQLETHYEAAAKLYEKIIHNRYADDKLRAYALGDLGKIWLIIKRKQPDEIDKAIQMLEESSQLIPPNDANLSDIFHSLSWIYHSAKCDVGKSLSYAKRLQKWAEEQGDGYSIIEAYRALKILYGVLGHWKEALHFTSKGVALIDSFSDTKFLGMRFKGVSQWAVIRAGRYREAEISGQDALAYARQVDDVDSVALIVRELGYIVGLQRNYHHATAYFSESQKFYEKAGLLVQVALVLGYQGRIWLNQHYLSEAEEALKNSLKIKNEIYDNIGIPQISVWLGELEEIRYNQDTAEQYYRQVLDNYRWTGNRYYECEALVGLARVKDTQGKFADIPPLFAEAKALAQKYEYNDHFAALRLLQGHLAWRKDLATVLKYYQQTLIYALRYNRFLLDEVLFGDNIATPFQSIIPVCLQQGKVGHEVLLRLRKWWQTGKNDVGKPRPDTISPIPENIPLIEAERIARKREPGDGSPQKTVVERIEMELAKKGT